MSSATATLGRKIASAHDLSTIVRSMKALASSSIGQYERAVLSLVPYQRTVELGLSTCLQRLRPAPDQRADHLEPRDSGARASILFGSDQGLVGAFNEVLFEFSRRESSSVQGVDARVWTIGERMHELAADATLPNVVPLALPGSAGAIGRLIDQLLIEIELARERYRVTAVDIYHNRPTDEGGYAPIRIELLPLDDVWRARLLALPWPARNRPEVVGDVETALRGFVREYLFVSLFRACAESLASDNASRLASMQRAEKNIKTIYESLVLRFQRSRQESIDEELFEVVSGYDALSHDV
jgi:F-type H+-transporting ATPase subunit gamma